MSIINVIANATQNNDVIIISVAIIIINLLLISVLLKNHLPVLALTISKPQSADYTQELSR